MQEYYRQLVCGINFVEGLPGESATWVPEIVLGGINFNGMIGKLGQVSRQSLAHPPPEHRGRATYPVYRLSVWFISWAVAVLGARRGSFSFVSV